MQRVSFSKKGGMRPAAISLYILLSFLILAGLTAKSDAQGIYSAREQIYLKNITPLLYEFSQVASDVSASVLPLQSAAPEECASKFADYRGIIGSLAGQLGSMTPPPRLESVHNYAMQALEGYSKGLGLYFNACTEEDYGVKESLVSQGGVYINKSVGAVSRAYAEMENIKSAGPPVAKQGISEQITEGEITEGTTPAGTGMKTRERKTTAPEPPAPEAKSKEQVLAEISDKVQADMEAEEAVETAPLETESTSREASPHVAGSDEASMPRPSKAKTKISEPEKTEAPAVKAPEPTVEPTLPPPTEAPSMKSEEEPSPDVASAGEENVETKAGEEKAGEEPAQEKSEENKIEKLNQKIMEQANADKGSMAADGTDTVTAGSRVARTADEDEGAVTMSEPGKSDAEEPDNTAEGVDKQEVAVVPPGGTAEELKEEEVPVDDVKSWCQERYEIQTERDDCMKQRAVAKDRIDKLSNSYSGGTKEREVLDKCMSDWKEGGTYNYQMVISCTQFFCTQRGIEDCKDLSK